MEEGKVYFKGGSFIRIQDWTQTIESSHFDPQLNLPWSFLGLNKVH